MDQLSLDHLIDVARNARDAAGTDRYEACCIRLANVLDKYLVDIQMTQNAMTKLEDQVASMEKTIKARNRKIGNQKMAIRNLQDSNKKTRSAFDRLMKDPAFQPAPLPAPDWTCPACGQQFQPGTIHCKSCDHCLIDDGGEVESAVD